MSAVIVLGHNGTLGSEVMRQLKAMEILAIVSDSWGRYRESVFQILEQADEFEAPIINCIGKIPQNNPIVSDMIWSNAVFPNTLAAELHDAGMTNRVIHMSSDCVFGKPTWTSSTYRHMPNDMPAPIDAYGHTKVLGEVSAEFWTNVRSSFIAPTTGFWKWVSDAIDNGHRISGWSKARWNGTTVEVLARELIRLATEMESPLPIEHIASSSITNKHQMMMDIAKGKERMDFNPDWDISHVVDRALYPTIEVPPISKLIAEYYNAARAE